MSELEIKIYEMCSMFWEISAFLNISSLILEHYQRQFVREEN